MQKKLTITGDAGAGCVHLPSSAFRFLRVFQAGASLADWAMTAGSHE
jgi:hypothetical protein